MSRLITLLVCLISLQFLFCDSSVAFSRTVMLGERFCDAQRRVCLKGSVLYDAGTGIVKLHGRVGQIQGTEGVFNIALKVTRRDGHSTTLKLNIPLSGRSFALVEERKKFKKGWGDGKWSILHCRFARASS